MASHNEMEIEIDEKQIPEGESDLDSMAQQVHNLFKFKNFLIKMNFDAEQRLIIMKTIFALTDYREAQVFSKIGHIEERDTEKGPRFSTRETNKCCIVITTGCFM